MLVNIGNVSRNMQTYRRIDERTNRARVIIFYTVKKLKNMKETRTGVNRTVK